MKTKITGKTILSNLDTIITGTTLLICVILVNVNVLMRYFINRPLKWCDEVVTSLFVWTVFIGTAYAHRRHAHLGVDILVNLFPPKGKRVIQFIMDILQILVLLMLTVISAQYVYHLIYVRGVYKLTMTDTLRVPKWWTGIAVPIRFGLSLIYAVYFFLKDRLHLIKGFKPQAPIFEEEPEVTPIEEHIHEDVASPDDTAKKNLEEKSAEKTISPETPLKKGSDGGRKKTKKGGRKS